MLKSKSSRWLAGPYLVWMAIFTVVPLFIVIWYAMTNADGQFTFDNLTQIGRYSSVFARSLILAAISTVICLVMAFPVGYFLSRLRANKQHIMLMLIMLPMWMNFLLRTYSWMFLLEKRGLINSFLGLFGIGPFQMINTQGAIVLGIIGLVLVRNTPQECGMYPDNVTREVYEREYFQGNSEDNGGWTAGKLLKTKELWLCALIIGINQLVTTGVMSQLVVRNTSLGFSQEAAVGLMTVCAIIGVCGSYLFGAIDQKFGVKKAIILFLIWYCIALAINCTDTTIGVYVSVAMIGIAVGAAANFIVSLSASVFGRHGFTMVNSVFFPLMQIVLMTNYQVNAFAIRVTGSLRGAYIFYIGLLVVNMILTAIIHPTRYNKDVATEQELMK